MREVSKLLAYVLRHNPGELGLELTPDGWVPADLLLERLAQRRGVRLTMAELERLVAADAKGRYSLRDGRIRANQGHSVDVQAVDPTPRTPPAVLYHGTTVERWERIRATGGLKPMRRHHVHLSADARTAQAVGSRHRRERPLVLVVDAAAMAAAGHAFLLSENGVWMADAVPVEFLRPDPT